MTVFFLIINKNAETFAVDKTWLTGLQYYVNPFVFNTLVANAIKIVSHCKSKPIYEYKDIRSAEPVYLEQAASVATLQSRGANFINKAS